MINPVPYPPDTRAKGWRFEIDHERIRQSDTWALASPEVRPWLLMLWMVAWEQTPCGSLPSDDELIAARIGMSTKIFAKNKAVLMRAWYQAEDGRLYHPTITSRVLEMLETKQKEKDRKAAYRAKMSLNVPRDNRGTDAGQTRTDSGNDATGTGTGTGTSLKPYPDTVVGNNTDTTCHHQAPSSTTDKFSIYPNWEPSETMAQQLQMALLPKLGTPEYSYGLTEFRSHWLTKPGMVRSQTEWDNALLKSLKHNQLRGTQLPPSRASPGNFKQTTRAAYLEQAKQAGEQLKQLNGDFNDEPRNITNESERVA
ncbi:MAG: DnaT-like ssDNA-binding domain-containing protein [Burkholderiales bacterium]